MVRNWKRLGIALFALAGCGPDGTADSDEPSNTITGVVEEWKVDVDHSKAVKGSVTFTISNEGTIAHEFLIVRTDLADGKIPTMDGRFSEDEVEVVNEIPEFEKGTTESLTLDLEVGTYQLVCNISGHYDNGMHTVFEVVAA